MQQATRTPIVLPASEGRRLSVIGHEITVKLTTAETGGMAYVFEDLCPPGVGVPPHVHQHEDELVSILEGEYEIFLDGQTYHVTQGGIVNFPRLVPHAFRNSGAGPARALFTVTPGASFERFFNELSSLPAGAPPDPAKITEIFRRYGMAILEPEKA